MQPIEIVNDGLVDVKVQSPDGQGETSVKLDVYAANQALVKQSKEWDAEGRPDGGFATRAQALFASLGLPGLSSWAAVKLAGEIADRSESLVGKSEATPQAA